ncbi:scaffolding protein [Escherichia phage LAMP]|uniref:Scaffolding protein n=1 Tax=Escherichia phage LAMP TaxID=2065191 RepID=A0A2I6PCY9_9CAUD|nr:scaffolding protein [Escherichia phage LAMP]
MPQDNYIDPNDFKSFLQLDDLKGSFKEELGRLESEQEPEVDIDDEFPEKDGDDFDFDTDLLGESNELKFEDEDGWEDRDEEGEVEEDGDNSDEGDENAEVEEEDSSDAGYEDDSADGEGEVFDVDYETVITLPDGREMTIEELSNGYLTGADMAERETTLQRHMEAFEERVVGLKDVLELASLEADRVIEDYNGFDWDKLAVEDPQAYVENKRFLEKYTARRNQLEQAQIRIKQEAAAKEQEAFQAKSIECVNILKREIPNWDENLYQNLMQYAIDLGATEEEVLKENRPSIFLALHKAYQFDKGKQQVMAKIKRPGAPRKVVKSDAAKSRTSNKPDNAKVAKAFAEGRVSHEDAFKFLVD